METTTQVLEMLWHTAFVASELEVRIGEQSIAQEQLWATAKRAQKISEQAMKETKELELMQQATAAQIKQYVADIGVKTQEQADRTLLQECTSK